VLVLTLLYKLMPNTKVEFVNAFIAALLAGAAYQIVQMLYLNGQIWITKYNAIYGTFAAIPCCCCGCNYHRYIVLIGATLSFAAQNVRNFFRTRNQKHQSTLPRFFHIDHYFGNRKTICRRKTASQQRRDIGKLRIPIRLTNDILDDLQNMQIISAIPIPKKEPLMAYQPRFGY